MPKLVRKPPSYRRHKPSDRAFVLLDGRRNYLGKWDSAESHRRYHALIADWIARGESLPAPKERPEVEVAGTSTVLVKHVVLHFVKSRLRRYKSDDGREARELASYRSVSRLLITLYGDVPAASFGPKKLTDVQRWMVRGGWTYRDPNRHSDPDAPRKVARPWCRQVANRQLGRIKFMFKKAVAAELIAERVARRLDSVAGLEAGELDARESVAVRPVAEAHAGLAMAFMPPPVAAMVRLQLITGMRPHEVVEMRGCDLDTGGKTWAYAPARHKTQHLGAGRTVYLGPEAQAVVRPFLRPDLSVPLFSPRDAEAWRRERQRQQRVTPLNQGNRTGYGTATRAGKRRRAKEPGEGYSVASYRRCIDYACAKAFPHPDMERRDDESVKQHAARIGTTGLKELAAWRKANRFHPHQSRHTAATRIAKEFRLEVAQAVLGYKNRSTTERYAELADDLAREAMERAG